MAHIPVHVCMSGLRPHTEASKSESCSSVMNGMADCDILYVEQKVEQKAIIIVIIHQ